MKSFTFRMKRDGVMVLIQASRAWPAILFSMSRDIDAFGARERADREFEYAATSLSTDEIEAIAEALQEALSCVRQTS